MRKPAFCICKNKSVDQQCGNRAVDQRAVYPTYRNDPKFSDRQFWANSADPDQTAPRVGV